MLRLTILFVCLSVLLIIQATVSHTKCGPVCEINCIYGNNLDANGCPICSCGTISERSANPCGGRRKALQGYNCGRSPNHQDCPSRYECVIAPNDAYAVCCPRRR